MLLNSLSCLIDTSYLLTLGVILLISGGIMLYCYRRLNLLEESIIDQGKILQTFILNHNKQIEKLSSLNNNFYNMNNFSNINSEYPYVSNDINTNFDTKKINLENSKINVSDDDEDDEENDDEEDDSSENDSSSDEENESTTNNIKLVKNSDINLSNQNNDSDYDSDEENNDLQIIEGSSNDELNNLETINLNNEEEDFINNLPIPIDSLSINLLNNDDTSKKINLDDESKVPEKRGFSRLKIDELRTLAVTKNLTDNDGASKMKKNDLIRALQNM